MLLTELVPPGAVAAGAVLAAGELLAPLGVALVAERPQRPRPYWVTGWRGQPC